MAWYGSRTAKSTILIGTTLEPQVPTNLHLDQLELACLRKWARTLYKRLSFKDRVKLQLDSTGVTKRSTNRTTGQTVVSDTQTIFQININSISSLTHDYMDHWEHDPISKC